MNAPNDASGLTPHVSRLTFERSAIIFVLLLAAYLRLNHLEWTEFKQDEAHLSQLAYDMARYGQIPLTSIGSSVGVANLPLAAWLLAVPYRLSSSPIVATGFIAALNVLAVAMAYGLARKLFAPLGEPAWLAALAATLLFATAPWAVLNSRKIWANDLLPPFVIAWAWTGWLAFVRGRPGALIGHAALLAVCIQLHYSAVLLLLVSAIWAIAFLRRISWKHGLAAIILFGATFAPFVVADALRGWPSVNRLIDLSRQPATANADAADFAWLMTTGDKIHSLAGPQEFENYLASTPNFGGLTILEGGLVLAGLVVALADVTGAIRRGAWDEPSAAGLMLATWSLLPVVSQISHRTPLFPHYFIILYPVQYLLAGWLIVRVRPAWRWVRWIAIGAVVLIGLAQAYQILALQQFVATRPTPGGAGIPIGYFETITTQAKTALHESGAAEILINTRGIDPGVDEYPAIFDFLLNDTPHRFVDAHQSAWVYAAQPQIQILFEPDDRILPSPATAAPDLVANVTLRSGEQPAQILRWDGLTSIPCARSAYRANWANGVQLLAATITSLVPGQSASIRLCIQIDRLPSRTDYHWTNQLFDAAGKRWAQIDGAGYLSRYWRPGDVIIQEFPIELPADLPAGEYKLRVGQYTYPDLANVPLIDSLGNPQSDAVEIPARVTR